MRAADSIGGASAANQRRRGCFGTGLAKGMSDHEVRVPTALLTVSLKPLRDGQAQTLGTARDDGRLTGQQ